MCLQEPFHVSKCYTASVNMMDTIPYLCTKNAQQSQALLRGVMENCASVKKSLLVSFSIFKHNQYFTKYLFGHVAQNNNRESLTERRLLKICTRQSLAGYWQFIIGFCEQG